MDFLESMGFGNESKVKAANKALERNRELLQGSFDTNEGHIQDYLNQMTGIYGNAPQGYQDALTKYINKEDFKYDSDVNKFMSPAMENRIKEATNAITKSQANAGNMFSSDYLNQLNAKTQAMASEEWDKAYDRMLRDRANALQEYQVGSNKLANIASMLGADQGKYADTLGSYYTNRINNQNALVAGLTDINTQKAQNELNKKSSWASLLNPFG